MRADRGPKGRGLPKVPKGKEGPEFSPVDRKISVSKVNLGISRRKKCSWSVQLQLYFTLTKNHFYFNKN